jgi:Bacterial extracellular solute-binding protein, family 7
MEQKGVVPIAWGENGFREVTNSTRAIRRPDDLQGLKIRVPPVPIVAEIFEALGAKPVPMNWDQALEAFLPEAFEAVRRQSRVTDGRVDRLVPKVVLDCTGVLAVVCELVAAGMPQHVTVDEKWESGGLASPRDHALIAGNAEGCQALTDEDMDACRGLTL